MKTFIPQVSAVGPPPPPAAMPPVVSSATTASGGPQASQGHVGAAAAQGQATQGTASQPWAALIAQTASTTGQETFPSMAESPFPSGDPTLLMVSPLAGSAGLPKASPGPPIHKLEPPSVPPTPEPQALSAESLLKGGAFLTLDPALDPGVTPALPSPVKRRHPSALSVSDISLIATDPKNVHNFQVPPPPEVKGANLNLQHHQAVQPLAAVSHPHLPSVIEASQQQQHPPAPNHNAAGVPAVPGPPPPPSAAASYLKTSSSQILLTSLNNVVTSVPQNAPMYSSDVIQGIPKNATLASVNVAGSGGNAMASETLEIPLTNSKILEEPNAAAAAAINIRLSPASSSAGLRLYPAETGSVHLFAEGTTPSSASPPNAAHPAVTTTTNMPIRIVPDMGSKEAPTLRLVQSHPTNPASQAAPMQYFPETQLIEAQPLTTVTSNQLRILPATNNLRVANILEPPEQVLIPLPNPSKAIADAVATMDTKKKPSPEKEKSKEPANKKRKSLIEPMRCFKCMECGYLGLTSKQVEEHVLFEHDPSLGEDDDDMEWMSIALKEGIKLLCPFCPNTFHAEGSRSFKVHVIDDHGVNETDAEKHFKDAQVKRKTKTLEFLKVKREEERELRRKSRKDVLEAYVDERGELRVRSIQNRPSGSAGNDSKAESCKSDAASSVNVDVSADEYVQAVDRVKQMQKAKKSGAPLGDETLSTDTTHKALIDLVEKSRKRKIDIKPLADLDKELSDATLDDGQLEVDIEEVDIESLMDPDQQLQPSVSPLKKRRVGRPKGSRSIGFSKLKRLNPHLELSDKQIGVICGVEDCAVRIKDPEKLLYHRSSHVSKPKDSSEMPSDASFKCQECGTAFEQWGGLAMHLWRNHQIDIELFSCPECSTFKSFSLAKLETHKLTHQSDRPFLCDLCAKGFKTAKILKCHKKKHESGKSDGCSARTNATTEAEGRITCSVCHRTFRGLRQLRSHMESVHGKLKPHLCNFCGYSAASTSSLKLHLRVHTGEKPYACNECDYASADHNSLRRHRMRHTGVKQYKCPLCDYSSIQSTTYKLHLKSKHPDHATQGFIFQCSKCLFKTVKEGNYLAHIAEHQNEKTHAHPEKARKATPSVVGTADSKEASNATPATSCKNAATSDRSEQLQKLERNSAAAKESGDSGPASKDIGLKKKIVSLKSMKSARL